MILTAEALTVFACDIIAASGSLRPEAEEVARHLVEANLKGHDSHGVGMIPTYVRNVAAGHLHPNRHATLVSETSASAVFDGGMGYGQVIAREAMNWGVGRAKAAGLAAFALRNTHHVARVGTYGEQAIASGLISIHFVNVLIGPGRVAPFGGRVGRYGTDPVCIAFPGTDKVPPVVLDFATSRVAAGKLRVAMNEGKKMPPGMLIDAEGKDATDPKVFYRENGAMLPFGEHKGSGLALACQLLAGALTGGGVMQGNLPNHGVKNGMLAILIDPARFGDLAAMRHDMETLIAWVKSAPPRPGTDAIMVAGDPEREARKKRLKDGIPIDANTWRELVEAAQKARVAVPPGDRPGA